MKRSLRRSVILLSRSSSHTKLNIKLSLKRPNILSITVELRMRKISLRKDPSHRLRERPSMTEIVSSHLRFKSSWEMRTISTSSHFSSRIPLRGLKSLESLNHLSLSHSQDTKSMLLNQLQPRDTLNNQFNQCNNLFSSPFKWSQQLPLNMCQLNSLFRWLHQLLRSTCQLSSQFRWFLLSSSSFTKLHQLLPRCNISSHRFSRCQCSSNSSNQSSISNLSSTRLLAPWRDLQSANLLIPSASLPILSRSLNSRLLPPSSRLIKPLSWETLSRLWIAISMALSLVKSSPTCSETWVSSWPTSRLMTWSKRLTPIAMAPSTSMSSFRLPPPALWCEYRHPNELSKA